MFPNWVSLKDGSASDKTTRVIRSLVDKVEGVTPKHDATSLRNGSTDDMAYNYTLGSAEMTFRGGWDFSADNKMWRYLTQNSFIRAGGMALSGFKDTRRSITAPTCDSFITSENRATVERIVKRLFGSTGYKEFEDDGNLAQFRFVLFASLLNNFETMLNDLCHTHLLFARIFSITNLHDVTYNQLKEWAKKVRVAWELSNTMNLEGQLSDADMAYISMEKLLEDYQKHKSSDAAQKAELKSLNTKVDALTDMLSTLLTMRAGRAKVPPVRAANDGNYPHCLLLCIFYFIYLTLSSLSSQYYPYLKGHYTLSSVTVRKVRAVRIQRRVAIVLLI